MNNVEIRNDISGRKLTAMEFIHSPIAMAMGMAISINDDDDDNCMHNFIILSAISNQQSAVRTHQVHLLKAESWKEEHYFTTTNTTGWRVFLKKSHNMFH